ncbi:Methyl-accepting chemotaxis protein [Chitinispirillum alkaliphilum]|nr:Methyl-accepting chemotaxis protein [Chitinispirillum alkaliphilum]
MITAPPVPSSQSTMKALVKVDSEKCVNCHQCISVCPSKFCNNGSGDYVDVNADLCIGCGACLEACTHEARSGIDDFDEFMAALQNNKKMVAIVAPAIAANFPDRYLHFNGWLKSIGVQAAFDVSFGAELTIKSYLAAIKKEGLQHVIAQPCPALVGYIQLYHPEMLKYLAPADSPMMHTMKMVREFYPEYKYTEFVVISPCYAKRREFDEVGIGDYNVTYKSFDNYFRSNNISLSGFNSLPYDNPEAERAVLFSTPGGLLRTAQREHPGVEASTRKIEGRHTIYHYLDQFMGSVNRGTAPMLIDCLNCEMGCNGGPGTLNVSKSVDEVERLIEKRNISAQQAYLKKAGILGKYAALKRLRKHIDSHWKPGLYDRRYVDRSALKQKLLRTPGADEFAEINRSMYKEKDSDILDCCSCGYNTCEQMAIAIFNGLNRPENCRHYQEVHIVKMQQKAQKELQQQRKQVISDINTSFEDAIEQLASVAGAAEEMGATINEISKNANESSVSSKAISTKSEDIATVIAQLSDSAKQISAVTDVISGIASQTNLLALNATIEAATAGEAGKGFAVVATEVKELAKQAAGESAEIAQKIEMIKTLTSRAVENVNSISQTISNSELMVDGIATAIEEQSAVTNSMSQSIARILESVKNGLNLLNRE